jgi:hypothetical protein
MRGITALLLIGALTVPAAAQERAAAEALFQEGRRLANSGKHAEACAKFAASDKLDPSVGARLQLGRCNIEQGKTASAWLAYKDAENLAARNGDSARAATARKEAEAIEPRLSYVVLRPTAADADRRVWFDGDEKPAVLLGQRFPVDPGEHQVSATASGYTEWKTTIAVTRPGETAVEIPALEAIKTAEPDKPDKPVEPDETIESGRTIEPDKTLEVTSPVEDGDPGRSRKVLAYAVAGGGAALIGTGVIFGQLARSAYNDRVDHCEAGNVCTPEGIDLIDKAQSRATLATVLTIAGGAAAVAGVVLYITAPKRSGRSIALVPSAGPGFAGFAIGGPL